MVMACTLVTDEIPSSMYVSSLMYTSFSMGFCNTANVRTKNGKQNEKRWPARTAIFDDSMILSFSSMIHARTYPLFVEAQMMEGRAASPVS
jgi:hypothetical protein